MIAFEQHGWTFARLPSMLPKRTWPPMCRCELTETTRTHSVGARIIDKTRRQQTHLALAVHLGLSFHLGPVLRALVRHALVQVRHHHYHSNLCGRQIYDGSRLISAGGGQGGEKGHSLHCHDRVNCLVATQHNFAPFARQSFAKCHRPCRSLVLGTKSRATEQLVTRI